MLHFWSINYFIIITTILLSTWISNIFGINTLDFMKIYPDEVFVHSYLCLDIESRLSLYKKMWQEKNIRISESVEIEIPHPYQAHNTLFLLDTDCHYFESISIAAEKNKLYGSPYKWLILFSNKNVSEEDETKIIEDDLRLMNNFSWLPDSDITIYPKNYINISNHLKVYKISDKSNLKIENHDMWQNTKSTAVRRRDILGSNIVICYVLTDNDTFHHLTDYKNREIDTITKVNYILTEHVINWMNGTRISSFTTSWGYKDDNTGIWSGMLGYLTTSRADIGGSPLFVTADRIPVIDYIAMPTPTRSKFVFRQPKLSYTSNVFLLPFRTSVWTCSLILLLVLSILLLVASLWERRKYQAVGSETINPGISDVVLVSLGAMCQQGSSILLKGIVGRIILLLLFMSLMFLYTSYSANIVALLQSSSSRIVTLQDLLSSRLKFGVHDTVFNRHYFSTATEPTRKAIYDTKIAPAGQKPHFISLEEGVNKMRQGLYAFHMEIGVGYKVVEEIFHEGEKCGLQEIQYLQVVDPWLAVQKNSSYREIFKLGFRRIQQFGLQSRENWVLYTAKPRCTSSGSNFVSVGLIDTEPAFLALAWGFFAALALLCLELSLHKYQHPYLPTLISNKF